MLLLISQIPVRLYYSPVRYSYALFYHPLIGVFRQKKIVFRNDHYKITAQKSSNIKPQERAMTIDVEFGQGLLRMKKKFYVMESYFRSRNDIYRLEKMNTKTDETVNAEKEKKQNETQEEDDMWQTVMEQNDQYESKRKSSKKKTI